MGSPAERVIVTDGETRTALAVVRALGHRGHAVHVLAHAERSLAGASRYAASASRVPDPGVAPLAFAKALEAEVARRGAGFVLPLSEVTLGTLYHLGLHDSLPAVLPPRAAYAAVTDKARLLELAAARGLGVPRTLVVAPGTPLEALPRGFELPVVLKARRSHWLAGGTWRAGGARVLRSAAELGPALASPEFAGGALLQEFVPGWGEGLFLLFDRGQPRAIFAHRRLRERPPSGGVSVLCESIDPDPDLLGPSAALLADLGWHGVAMVEFRRAANGRAALMEVNPRLWGSLQLAIDAGVDFPALLLALHRGETLPQVAARAGVRSRWLLGDVDHLLIALRRKEMRRAVGRSAPRVVGAFLAGFFDGSRSDVFRARDPRPFLRELGGWAADALRRVRAPRDSGVV